MRALLVLIVCFVGVGFCTYGVDMSTLVSTSSFNCMKANGKSFAVVRVYMSVGRPDPNGPQTIKNARAAGLPYVDGYIFPCPTCSSSGAAQVNSAISFLRSNGANFGMIWLDIEGTQYWTNNHTRNIAFLSSMASELNALKVNWGVYTSQSQWTPITGGWTGYSSKPLWYAHYDGSANFNDFRAFGGWTKPTIKQYQGTTTFCSAGVDLSWYPD